MQTVIIDRIIKLADKFFKLSKMIDVPISFINALKNLLKHSISREEVSEWADKNPAIENKLDGKWFLNYDDENKLPYLFTLMKSERRIYLSPNDPSSFVVKESILVQGHKSIPNLWIYVGSRIFTDHLGELEKDIAHNGFIAEGLSEMFPFSLDKKQKLIDLTNFLRDNAAVINKIRSSMEFTPKMLGQGADGVAYAIGDNMVLKIFKDKSSYNKAFEAMTRLHKDPSLAKTEAMIYDLGFLGNFQGNNIYYYIMEKMRPIRNFDESYVKIIHKIVRAIGLDINNDRSNKWNLLKQKMTDPSQKEEVLQEIRNFSEIISSHIMDNMADSVNKITNELKLKPSWLNSLAEEIVIKFLTGRGDLHLGNMGVTNQGELRYFDPSHQDWQDEINIYNESP